MSKVEFNIVPVADYGSLNEEQVCEFENMIRYMKEQDLVYIPEEFYTEVDCQGKSFLDIMCERKDSSMQLFVDLIMKQKNTSELYIQIRKRCQLEEVALAAVKENYHDKYKSIYTICKKEEVPRIKRTFLKQYKSYKQFIEKAGECYPDLIFHEQCFDSINVLGRYQDTIYELDKNLSALNDFGAEIYEKEQHNEARAINKLESQCSVICSGKGSNENKSFKIKYVHKKQIKKESCKEVELTCNPHLKLFSKHSNKRIYFCWGRKEIENHKIIVARIGGHWE